MNYYDLIKKYGANKGEQAMWMATKRISDYIRPMKEENPKEYWRLIKSTYADMCGKHFNQEFAKWQMEQMYYTDKDGNKHYAPYWSEEAMKQEYEKHKAKIENPVYNMYDYMVVMNMIKSDYCNLLHKWFPTATNEEMLCKINELTVNWLNDKDNPFGDGVKAWCYFNYE